MSIYYIKNSKKYTEPGRDFPPLALLVPLRHQVRDLVAPVELRQQLGRERVDPVYPDAHAHRLRQVLVPVRLDHEAEVDR